MIPLDLAPLTVQHLWLLGGGVAVVFFGLGWLIKKQVLRVVDISPSDRVYYAGSVLLAATVSLSYLVLGNSPLTIGLAVAGLLVLFSGTIDENDSLPVSHQLAWQLLAAAALAGSGWAIQYVSHPFGQGVIVVPWGIVLTIGWLLLLMNAMNWLDGVDGLAPGVGTIALGTLAAVALLPSTQDSTTLSLALVGVGCVLGFLLWNLPPARIYLGTTGSWWLGLFLGSVAIVGGGKIVTTLLVLAWPVADAVWVVAQRLLAGKSVWQGGDDVHLHHKLLAHGISARTIALTSMVVTMVLGYLALTLQTFHKVIGVLFIIVLVATMSFLLTGRVPHVKIRR